MFELMLRKPKVEDKENAAVLNLTQAEIKFQNVSFAYDEKRPIIKDLTFTIKSGQKVAVVGESGSGKSTLVKLLFRFYDCTEGIITIDGQDICQVTQHSLRKSIGIVPQDTVLFNDTLFANVHYGEPQASAESVNAAFKLAHLSDFVSRLPEGVETVVGERGLKLSGGEKQRVAIARTILKNPQILVFDEATSSLDSQSEQAILSAIKEVAKQRTSLVIAHRLSTIVDADMIIVMRQGEIIEQGTHQELLVKQGHYYNMWQLQQSDQS